MPGIKSIVFFFIPSACPANKSNVSGVTDHLYNPSFEVDENGETKPVIFLAYFVQQIGVLLDLDYRKVVHVLVAHDYFILHEGISDCCLYFISNSPL